MAVNTRTKRNIANTKSILRRLGTSVTVGLFETDVREAAVGTTRLHSSANASLLMEVIDLGDGAERFAENESV
jgi:hypothetical protein